MVQHPGMAQHHLVVLEVGTVFWRAGGVQAALSTSSPACTIRAPPLFGAALHGGLLSPTAHGCEQALRRVREELALSLASLLCRVLHLSPSACRVAVVAPCVLPDALRGALLRALVRDVGAAGAAVLPAPLAAAVGAGCWTALVVDVGERCARVTPVVHGHVLAHAAREAGAGGAALHAVACALTLAAADAAASAPGIAAVAASLPKEGTPLPALAVSPLVTLHPAAASLALGRSAQPYGAGGAPWRSGLRDWELPILAGAPAARLQRRALPVGGDDAAGAVALWVEHALAGAGRAGWGEAVAAGGGGAGGGAPALLAPLPPHVAAALALPGGAAHLPLPAAPWRTAAGGALLLCPNALARAAAGARAGLAGAGARSGHLPAARAALGAALAVLCEGGGAVDDEARAALPRAVAEALLACPVDARRALAGAVVVVGGPAGGAGFGDALVAAVRDAVGATPALAPLRALARAPGALAARASACGAAPADAAFVGGVLLAAAMDAPGARGAPSALARASFFAGLPGGAPAVGLLLREEDGDGTAPAATAVAVAAAALAAAAAPPVLKRATLPAAPGAVPTAQPPSAAAPPAAPPAAVSAAARLAAMGQGLANARKGGAGKPQQK